jgi:molybdopterin/thiamine biosynthesis adenylyltransferase
MILGVGSLGTNIVMLLAAMGYKNFVLCDGDQVSESNLNRQIIFKHKDIGGRKVKCVQKWLNDYDKNISVTVIDSYLSSEKDFKKIPDDLDMIILTADEPYREIVKLTSIFCKKKKISWVRMNNQGFGPLKTYNYSKNSCPYCKILEESKLIQNILPIREVNTSLGCIAPDILSNCSKLTKLIFNHHVFEDNFLTNRFVEIHNDFPFGKFKYKKIKFNEKCFCRS